MAVNVHPVRVKTSAGWQELALTGPQGPPGPAGGIPGEVKLWPGTTLPDPVKYGKWVWADGASYSSTTYPEASNNIAPAWKTFGGAADPGAGNFRVPDLRGLVPMGLDQMPGGTRANRTTRASAITIAATAGNEYVTLTLAQMASHSHTGATGGWSADHTHTFSTGYVSSDHSHSGTTSGDSVDHVHNIPSFQSSGPWANAMNADAANSYAINTAGINQAHTHTITTGGISANHTHSGTTAGASANHTHAITAEGGGGNHENLPPTVFVPYIVRLDG